MQTISESEIIIKSTMVPGSEGKTFSTNLGVYKKFHESISEEIRLIKIQQLYYLETLNFIKEYFPELRYIVENEKICGYIMEQITGFNLASREFGFDTKISLLRVIMKRLDILSKNGIIYLDIRDPNIVIKDIENEENNTVVYYPKFLDTDSIIISGYYENHVPICLNKYMKHGGKIDKNAQNFMFNYYTANVLSRHRPEYDKVGKKMLKQLTQSKVDTNIDNEYLLDHIIGRQK